MKPEEFFLPGGLDGIDLDSMTAAGRRVLPPELYSHFSHISGW